MATDIIVNLFNRYSINILVKKNRNITLTITVKQKNGRALTVSEYEIQYTKLIILKVIFSFYTGTL